MVNWTIRSDDFYRNTTGVAMLAQCCNQLKQCSNRCLLLRCVALKIVVENCLGNIIKIL